jgi:hypothetical protein
MTRFCSIYLRLLPSADIGPLKTWSHGDQKQQNQLRTAPSHCVTLSLSAMSPANIKETVSTLVALSLQRHQSIYSGQFVIFIALKKSSYVTLFLSLCKKSGKYIEDAIIHPSKMVRTAAIFVCFYEQRGTRFPGNWSYSPNWFNIYWE